MSHTRPTQSPYHCAAMVLRARAERGRVTDMQERQARLVTFEAIKRHDTLGSAIGRGCRILRSFTREAVVPVERLRMIARGMTI